MCQLLAVALMLSLCQQTSIHLQISKASYFMSYAWFQQQSLIGYCSLWLLKPFVVQPGSCSGPFASPHACLDRFCPGAMFPISLMPQSLSSLWDFDSKKSRERGEESIMSLKSKSISLTFLTVSALADSLPGFVGHNCCSPFFLGMICHWFCRCSYLSLLGISVQVTDLQVLLETGYWARQTSALTQYCCSYDFHSICLISVIYQLGGGAGGGDWMFLLLLFTRAQTGRFFSVRWFLRGVAKADGQKAASYSPASKQMAALPVWLIVAVLEGLLCLW